jgi:predicted RNA-binding protein with PUA-like domain
MSYWLMKSEPDAFSIDMLRARKRQTEHWDGVRNYQARNYMRSMKCGDQAFFYHSNCAEPSIVGVVTISREAYPDHTQFDSQSKYFDADATPDNPRWFMVDVAFREKFTQPVTLTALKAHAPALGDFALIKKGSRLSVMPVSASQWNFITSLTD